ncbi:unnamed protein product [Lathyrus sativus]|nr:unnamed protein product [Lathyrus sativus]
MDKRSVGRPKSRVKTRRKGVERTIVAQAMVEQEVQEVIADEEDLICENAQPEKESPILKIVSPSLEIAHEKDESPTGGVQSKPWVDVI